MAAWSENMLDTSPPGLEFDTPALKKSLKKNIRLAAIKLTCKVDILLTSTKEKKLIITVRLIQ